LDLELRGKHALVTGASKGIGKAIARALAAEGAEVCVVARDADALEKAAEEIRLVATGEILAVQGDVRDADLFDRVLGRLPPRWGGVDILVNNAGGPPPGSFLDHDGAAWTAALEQSFLAAVRGTKAVVPGMKQRNWGRIVSVASTVALEPTPGMVLSASVRGALVAFSKAIAIELAPHAITSNIVYPAAVHTERTEFFVRRAAEREGRPYDDVLAQRTAAIPARRFATPAEIADAVVFLASPRAAYITGTSIVVDGAQMKGIT
jgi:3-oxoacyl-[acyl-carrier protein] reductase